MASLFTKKPAKFRVAANKVPGDVFYLSIIVYHFDHKKLIKNNNTKTTY